MIAGGKRKVGDHQKDLLEILQPALSVFVAKIVFSDNLYLVCLRQKWWFISWCRSTTATADSDELRRWNELFHSAGEMFYSWKQVCFATVPALMALTELFMIANLTFTLCLSLLYLKKARIATGVNVYSRVFRKTVSGYMVRLGEWSHQKKIQNYRPINDILPATLKI